MTRHIRRASALILASALFSAGAWGQSTVLRQYTESVDVASEYFGSDDGREVGNDLKRRAGAPKVILAILDEYEDSFEDGDNDGVDDDALADDAAGTIGVNNVAHITYSFKGATFAETVSPTNLDLVSGTLAQDANLDIETALVSGGAKGDSSVTLEAKVVGANIITSPQAAADHRSATPAATAARLVFEVPVLQVKGAVLETTDAGIPTHVGVSVRTTIAIQRTRNQPFPGTIQGLDDDDRVETPTSTADNPDYAGHGPKTDKVEVAQSQVYNTKDPALQFAWQPAVPTPAAPLIRHTAKVDVTSRKGFIRLGNAISDPTDDTDAASPALRIGTILVGAPPADIPMDLGGRDPALVTTDDDGALDPEDYELGDDLGGDVAITVFGRFQTGDKVYLGSKEMKIAGPAATASMGIESLLQNVAAGDTEGTMDVVYVPGGVDDLRPGSFAANAMLDFNDSDNKAVYAGPATADGSTRYSVALVRYDGFSYGGHAYGIVRSGGTDQSYVRVTCGSTAPCQVFLDCTDQSGNSYWGELAMSIPGGATQVLSSDMIDTTLGGGWMSGRGRCDLLSEDTSGLKVQHMVRSGHTLVNSTAVVTGLPE